MLALIRLITVYSELMLCGAIIKQCERLSYLFERSLNLNALSPGHSGVGQAVSIVGSPGEVDALFVQVAESLGHHLHCVVGQRRGVLWQERKQSDS